MAADIYENRSKVLTCWQGQPGLDAQAAANAYAGTTAPSGLNFKWRSISSIEGVTT